MLTLTLLSIRRCVRVRDAMTPVGEYARTTVWVSCPRLRALYRARVLMAQLRSRRCEIGEQPKCTRVGCTAPAPFPQDKLDFPCSMCSEGSEAYYVENYGETDAG